MNLFRIVRTSLLGIALFLALSFFAVPRAALAQALPSVTITAVYPNLTSVKVDFAPIAAAKDYRIYETTNPMAVKYAGMVHLDADQLGGYSKLAFATDASGNPTYPLSVVNVGKYMAAHHIDVPVTEIELNGLAPGPHTLVVQAVDALGPAPAANLYDANNLPTMNAAAMSAMGGEGMDTMLGANAGTTPDGMDSTNGQGPSTDNPNVIAQSQPFTVTIPSGPAPIPSPGATAFFFDTFPSGTFAPAGANDVIKGNAAFTLTTPNGAWDVLESHCDIRDSRPFIMNSHYMAVDFDGQTPGSNEPLHVAYSGVGISAQKTAALAGNLLHATMEVDAHTDTRRWVGMLICDASDPLTAFDWEEGEAVNKGNTVLSVQWEAGNLMVAEVVNGHVTSITGPPGAAQHYAARWQSGWQFGHGLDNRSRFDLFVSQSHFAVYEDGHKEAEYDLPTPLPFAQAKVYDVQYLYHSALENSNDGNAGAPAYETYWHAVMPYSDERHWSACGWETLPGATTWTSVAALIQMPTAQAPVYAPPSVTITHGQASQIAALTSLVPVQGGSVDLDTLKKLLALLQGLVAGQ